jgi:hypothetical protein
MCVGVHTSQMITVRMNQNHCLEKGHFCSVSLPATITLKSITPDIKLNDRRKIEAGAVEPSPVKHKA